MMRTGFLLWLMCLLSVPVLAQDDSSVVFPVDAWRTDSPQSHGLVDDEIALIEAIIDDEMDYLASLLIVHEGAIIYEQYYDEGDETTLRNVFSVTKSVTSALTGIALEQGDLTDIQTPVMSFFPDLPLIDERKQAMTIENLLAMRSGLDWREGLSALSLLNGRIGVSDVIRLPMRDAPGDSWDYSTGNSQILSYILTEVTGVSLADYAERHLFTPLGITDYTWDKGADGYYLGGAGLSLSARDMAKFGFLYLNDGNWNGEQVVPSDWVRQSTARTESRSRSHYGWHWWLEDHGGYEALGAEGFSGQGIRIFPELDLIIVTQTEPSLFNFVSQQAGVRRLTGEIILPAMVD